jgi:hypothetical protein
MTTSYCPLLIVHCPLPTVLCLLPIVHCPLCMLSICCNFGSICFSTRQLLVENSSDLHLVDADSVSGADKQWAVDSEQWVVDSGQWVADRGQYMWVVDTEQ